MEVINAEQCTFVGVTNDERVIFDNIEPKVILNDILQPKLILTDIFKPEVILVDIFQPRVTITDNLNTNSNVRDSETVRFVYNSNQTRTEDTTQHESEYITGLP